MPSIDYFLRGDHEAAKQALAAALGEHRFVVEETRPDGGWTVGRGSRAATIWLGAFAGRERQRLTYAVRFFTHEDGTLVARFEREPGAGVLGGAIGISRSNDVFGEVSRAVGSRLTQQGLLAHSVAGA